MTPPLHVSPYNEWIACLNNMFSLQFSSLSLTHARTHAHSPSLSLNVMPKATVLAGDEGHNGATELNYREIRTNQTENSFEKKKKIFPEYKKEVKKEERECV